MSLDPEKGQSMRGPVSRPTYDWKPQSTFAPSSQVQMMRTAPPAHPPSTILQGSASRPFLLGSSLFQPRKKPGRTDSSTRLLTPEPLSHSHSPSRSLNDSEILVRTTVVQTPMVPASALDAELSLPPRAIRRHTDTGPLQLLPTTDPSQNGLTHYSPPRHSRISGRLSPIQESPSIPRSSAPFQEVTLHSPAVNRPPSIDGISPLVRFYFSRTSTESLDLPPLPALAIPRDSSVVLPITGYVPAARSVPAALSVGSRAVTPCEGVVSPPEAALSIGAVGRGYGRRPFAAIPESPPAHVVSPADSTDPSQYSDSEGESPPLTRQKPRPPPLLPVLQPTQPLRFSRGSARPSPSSEHRLWDPPHTFLDRFAPRALPIPPSVPRSSNTYSQPSSTFWAHSRQDSPSSSFSRIR
jgi:hypothetical protein